MKKSIVLIACILIVGAIALTTAQVNKVSLAQINDCKTVEWETEEPVYGTCQHDYIKTVCDDYPINKSCHEEKEIREYDCQTGTEKLTNSKEVCEPKALQITKEDTTKITETGKINFKDWGLCSYEKQDTTITVTCDSKYDGNSDGICQPGESCTKFVITPETVTRYIKNSREDFVEEDDSFFLNKLEYEVEG